MQTSFRIVHVEDDQGHRERLGQIFEAGFQRDVVTFEQRPDFTSTAEEIQSGNLADFYLLDNDIEGQNTRGGAIAQQIFDKAKEVGKEVTVITLLSSNPEGVMREYGTELDARGIAALNKMRDSAIAGFYIGSVIDMAIQHKPDSESSLSIPTFNEWSASPGVSITLGNGMGAWDVDWSLGRSIRGEAGSFYTNPQIFVNRNRARIEGRLDDRGKAEFERIFSLSPATSKEGGRPQGPATERR